jgi:glycosyltransferase involved in cell wall biosynthesis
MTHERMFSIIVNNYNYGRFLRDAIDSALAQTYPRVEVVVVDDGSTDDSREIIQSYGDKIIPVLKENGGQASAFNAGFAASHGDIIIFLDADDMLLPHTAQRVAQVWRPDVAKVQYELAVIDENNRPLRAVVRCRTLNTSQIRGVLRRGFLCLSPPTSGNAFARSALMELLPMPERQWRISADMFLYTLVPFLGEIVALCESLALYRVHGENESIKLEGWGNQRAWLLKLRAISEAFEDFAGKKGFSIPQDWLLTSSGTVAARFVACRVGLPDSPFPEDRLWPLFRAALRTTRTDISTTLRGRVLTILWLLAVAIAPRRMTLPLLALKTHWQSRRLRPRSYPALRAPSGAIHSCEGRLSGAAPEPEVERSGNGPRQKP